MARAIERNETNGLMKVVVDAETERILGAADASWKTFYQAVYIHPTMTEGFFALMNSVK